MTELQKDTEITKLFADGDFFPTYNHHAGASFDFLCYFRASLLFLQMNTT